MKKPTENPFVIFLDIDGVLVHWQYRVTQGYFYEDFDPACVENLNRLAASKKAKIVISSSWRLFHDFEWLQEKFKSSGVIAEVIDVTPEETNVSKDSMPRLSTEYDEQNKFMADVSRGEQIKKWIEENNPDDFLIIDDNVDDIIPFFDKEKIIHVKDGTTSNGLKWEHLEEHLK